MHRGQKTAPTLGSDGSPPLCSCCHWLERLVAALGAKAGPLQVPYTPERKALCSTEDRCEKFKWCVMGGGGRLDRKMDRLFSYSVSLNSNVFNI